jgi:hypothetical protein
MRACPCGIAAEDASILCARCAALQILELPANASQDEIKGKYHLLVKVWHPDRFQGDKKLRDAAEEKLKLINSTYLFLTSGSPQAAQPRSPQSHSSPVADREQPKAAPPPSNPPASSKPATAATPKPNAVKPASRARNILQTSLIVACVVGLCGLLAKVIDSRLPPKPGPAASLVADQAAPAPSINAPADQPAAGPPKTADRSARKTQPPPTRLLPFITVDMTRDEVLAIAGTPTSSSDDKLVYGGSELYFKDGKMVGWKIDPSTSSLRVKLWPDAPVDTSLQFFSVGSTKNDVLAVQGTPTTLAQGKFAYGGSEVYFENNRVVSWKNDPQSVPLRAIQR